MSELKCISLKSLSDPLTAAADDLKDNSYLDYDKDVDLKTDKECELSINCDRALSPSAVECEIFENNSYKIKSFGNSQKETDDEMKEGGEDSSDHLIDTSKHSLLNQNVKDKGEQTAVLIKSLSCPEEQSDHDESSAFNNSKSSTPSKHGPSITKLHDFMARVDESYDGSGSYYNTATSIWNNRRKILTTLRKEATDRVSALKTTTSMDKELSSLQNTPTSKSMPSFNDPGSCDKLETTDTLTPDGKVEGPSFFQGWRDKVSDPLHALMHKRREDSEEDETENFHPVRPRSTSSSGIEAKSQPQNKDSPSSSRSSTLKKKRARGDRPGSFSVTLSSLLGKRASDENDGERSPDTQGHLYDAVDTNKTTFSIDADDEIVSPEVGIPPTHNSQPTPAVLLCYVVVVFLYSVCPMPGIVHVFVQGFVCGVLLLCGVLCTFARPPRRAPFVLPNFLNHKIPHKVPPKLYDPKQPLKGWMNEAYSYDVDNYHISNTTSVFVTLDGGSLRLQTPQKNIPRRCLYKEMVVPVSNVIGQRIFDLTTAEVFLLPSGLVKKRVWSKKYPVCVRIPTEPSSSHRTGRVTGDDISEVVIGGNSVTTLYLFGRTDRQKEEWFYRIQRSINMAVARRKSTAEEGNSQQTGSEGKMTSSPCSDDWMVLEDQCDEESSPLACCSDLSDVSLINDQPMKAYRDYYLYISRLMPDDAGDHDSNPRGAKEWDKSRICTKEKDVAPDNSGSVQAPGLEVAWFNMLVGRVMFDFLRQQAWTKWLFTKIQNKLDKIKLPYFMEELKLTEMNPGSTVPLVHRISLPKLDHQGIWVEMEVTYNGSVQLSLETKLILTKLGKNDAESASEKRNLSRADAIVHSEAEDSAESSDDDDSESHVSRIVNHVTSVGQHFLGETRLTATDTGPSTSTQQPPSAGPGVHQQQQQSPKTWMRLVDRVAKSKYFQKATENEYIRRKLETVSNTPVLLTVELLQLSGVVAVNLPPPPSDRVWYGFREPPDMDLKAHPKVGERMVRMTHVTEWIEQKLKQEFIKLLVIPNMDNIPVPVMFSNLPSSC